ncbi:hypothetical protein [Desulfopila sp. IMCC35008]|uniref:hypothetical protein n=1 Tax=Desulfopila sp. IMCC35008 TaxID=2653858 RepID=UPI0013D7E533|nr:hypothetical protein [Desulfopila sp. IMCC35008]
MKSTSLPDYIQALLENNTFFPETGDVELIQTHISYILLVGERVYKFKKPVNFGFLNFTQLQQRKHFCEEEVRLNRRLCPEIYLGVVTVTSEGDRYRLDGRGEPVEYGVKMVRLPEERMMCRVIAANDLHENELRQIVHILVPFYEQAAGGRGVLYYGRPEAVRKTLFDSFRETQGYVGSPALSRARFTVIRNYVTSFFNEVQLFNERMTAGRIRECHGDLHSGNICLTSSVSIFDCLEFNKSLRCTDIAADIAFLAMDLDFNELYGMSDYFVNYFIECSGDKGLTGMLNFYKCYRAYVRGKINLLTAVGPGIDATSADAALIAADRYFHLAEKYGMA